MVERFPSGPSTRPPPFPLVNSASPWIGPGAVQGAKRRSGPLTARTDPGAAPGYWARKAAPPVPSGPRLLLVPYHSPTRPSDVKVVDQDVDGCLSDVVTWNGEAGHELIGCAIL